MCSCPVGVLVRVWNSIISVPDYIYILYGGLLARAMVLGSYQCRGVLLLPRMVGQGPAVLAASAGRVSFFIYVYIFVSSRLSYLPFLMPHPLGDG